MLERSPTKENLDVAYQGDFEDPAWTAFSEAQLPPPRVTLEDFAKHPFIAGEITSKSDYITHVLTWFSKALVDAGYKASEVDGLIVKSFDAIDFARPPEAFVADINRIVQDFYLAAPKNVTVAAKQSAQSAVMSGSVATGADTLITTAVPAPATAEVPMAVTESSLEPLVLDKPLSEVLVLQNSRPEPLILQPEQRVSEPDKLTLEITAVENNEPIVLQVTEAMAETVPKKLDVASEYQSKLEALGALPFNHEAYVEYVFDLHAGLRHQYDEVVTAARNNLKRFDGSYAPSTIEKQALQLLSSLQGYYARLQKPDTEIGIIRAELTNSLSVPDTQTSEIDVKTFTQNYLDATKKLFANISKLEGLIDIVKTEEKSAVAEVYRAQFEKMKTEGDQALQSLPTEHPLYERLKVAVEVDLQKLIDSAAVENGGDKMILENSSNFMARREQIKNLIGFVKQEQEYQDFFERARNRLQKLEVKCESIPTTESTAGVKKTLTENIEKIKESLVNTAPQIAAVGGLDTLRVQKDMILGLLGESGELLASLPEVETVLREPAGPLLMTNQEIKTQLASIPEASTIRRFYLDMRDGYQPYMAEAAGERATLDALERRKMMAEPSFREKITAIVSRIPFTKISKVAALGAVLAAATPNSHANSELSGNSVDTVRSLSLGMPTPVAYKFDASAVYDYLRTTELENEVVLAPELTPPIVDSKVPEPKSLPRNDEEAVPGVILKSPESNMTTEPLQAFSALADVPEPDKNFSFHVPLSLETTDTELISYLIQIGDVFWDISEGQSLAGKLPVMEQINPYFKQALIDLVRDELNRNPELRAEIGGFGDTADDLRAGTTINRAKLNLLFERIAVESGYLK